MEQSKPVYPLVLTNLHAMRCVVIGGGAVAERKVGDLLDGGAQPIVVSPTLTPRLIAWQQSGRIVYVPRPFMERDLDGAFLVIAATSEPTVNQAVAAAGRTRRCLVNIADDPDAGNFHTIAAIRQGDLLLTVSTGGSSPALAAHIRRELEARYGDAYARLTALLRILRAGAARRLPSSKRMILWQRLICDPVLSWLAEGRNDQATNYAYEQIAQLERDT